MDFFESQQRSYRNTRVLLVMMTLSVIAVVITVSLVLALTGWGSSSTSRAVPFTDWVLFNARPLAFGALLTAAFIGGASLYRISRLRRGGHQVAIELGGIPIGADDRDPLHRRLRNVVEEMAIASGVPVPEIFVLEKEAGINAFAAGFAPENAAIAVTRGALETLDRDELQGVIAHEYSHIFNGDMRLNLWLMGPLFGILSIALIGRVLMRSNSRALTRSRGAGLVTVLGLGLLVTGYVGLLLGRAIKASISRQREYLADASAVQYTRQTAGIAGALKKIAGLDEGSQLTDEDAEEVSHMLFAQGLSGLTSRLFASHPPLFRRIRALDPGFDRKQYRNLNTVRHTEGPTEREPASSFAPSATAHTTPDAVMASIANPGEQHIEAARGYLGGIPAWVRAELESAEGALLVPVALILHPDAARRAPQLELLQQRLGAERTERIARLAANLRQLDFEARLVVLELALPRIHQLPGARAQFVADLLETLALLDDQLEVFEYALTRIYRSFVNTTKRRARWKNLSDRNMQRAGLTLLQVFTSCAANDAEDQTSALERGVSILGFEGSIPSLAADWPRQADAALETLQDCVPRDRERVIRALVTAALHDGVISQPESELLRAFCVMLACPLPPILSSV